MNEAKATSLYIAARNKLRKAGCDDMEMLQWWCWSLTNHIDTAKDLPSDVEDFVKGLKSIYEIPGTEELH